MHHLLKLAAMTTHPPKITFGELRASGVRDVLTYCRDHRCSHSISMSADRRPARMRSSSRVPETEPWLRAAAAGRRNRDALGLFCM
jgi:hypothetical protein